MQRCGRARLRVAGRVSGGAEAAQAPTRPSAALRTKMRREAHQTAGPAHRAPKGCTSRRAGRAAATAGAGVQSRSGRARMLSRAAWPRTRCATANHASHALGRGGTQWAVPFLAIFSQRNPPMHRQQRKRHHSWFMGTPAPASPLVPYERTRTGCTANAAKLARGGTMGAPDAAMRRPRPALSASYCACRRR